MSVHYATADGTADSTDYVADSGTLSFAPGTTMLNIPVLIKGDALDEPDETFFVDLSSPVHAAIARARGTVTIVDDDPARLRVLDAAVDARWSVHRRYTRVARLVVSRAPTGATVEVRCSGKGCPFTRKQAGLKLAGLFGSAKLRPSTTVDIRIALPGAIGKVFGYRVRAFKLPRARVLCLPPAAAKPAPC